MFPCNPRIGIVVAEYSGLASPSAPDRGKGIDHETITSKHVDADSLDILCHDVLLDQGWNDQGILH